MSTIHHYIHMFLLLVKTTAFNISEFEETETMNIARLCFWHNGIDGYPCLSGIH